MADLNAALRPCGVLGAAQSFFDSETEWVSFWAPAVESEVEETETVVNAVLSFLGS